jgi:hypothetical protein
MTIADLKAAFRDLPDTTDIFIMDERPKEMEYRDVEALEIERKLTSDEDGQPNGHEDCFNIRLSA